MKKVLFVCSGNTCRSPVAEKIFNSICKERNLPYSAKSAGICTSTGYPMAENSLKALEELGIEDLEFTSTTINEMELSDVELFFAMSEDHKDILVRYYDVSESKVEVMNVADPYGGSLMRYRQCAEEILEKVKAIADELGEKNADN